MEINTIKRVIRAINSVLNLYDTEFPEELVDVMMEGIIKITEMLDLVKYAITDSNGMIVKYIVPDDFEDWNRRFFNAK